MNSSYTLVITIYHLGENSVLNKGLEIISGMKEFFGERFHMENVSLELNSFGNFFLLLEKSSIGDNFFGEKFHWIKPTFGILSFGNFFLFKSFFGHFFFGDFFFGDFFLFNHFFGNFFLRRFFFWKFLLGTFYRVPKNFKKYKQEC